MCQQEMHSSNSIKFLNSYVYILFRNYFVEQLDKHLPMAGKRNVIKTQRYDLFGNIGK